MILNKLSIKNINKRLLLLFLFIPLFTNFSSNNTMVSAATSAPTTLVYSDSIDNYTNGSFVGQSGWDLNSYANIDPDNGLWTVRDGDFGKELYSNNVNYSRSGSALIYNDVLFRDARITFDFKHNTNNKNGSTVVMPEVAIRGTSRFGGFTGYDFIYGNGNSWGIYRGFTLLVSTSSAASNYTNGAWYTIDLEVYTDNSNNVVSSAYIYIPKVLLDLRHLLLHTLILMLLSYQVLATYI